MMKKPPTPLEILKAEQRRVRESYRLQEEQLNEDFRFIHRHSGKCCFPVSRLFFSSRKEEKAREETEERGVPCWGYVEGLSPVLLEAAVPILMRWGVGKIGNLFRKKEEEEESD